MTLRNKNWMMFLIALSILFISTTVVSAAEILLMVGTKGFQVRTVQNYLCQLSYLRHKPTGYYGKLTREAVKSFQLEHGLEATGITDARTMALIQRAFSLKNCFFEYTVQPEEELEDVASKFGTPLAEIMAQNNLSGNEISVGQKLLIPAAGNSLYSVNSRGRSGIVQSIPWSIVNKLWRNGEIAKIIDVDTGKSFQVKRLYGTFHADIEPLTGYDTRTFLEIYGGRWSWARRAVIVRIRNLYIAASINGMPHGGQSIPNNNFPGQFCAHFLGSRVHVAGRVDSEHQEMVEKAAVAVIPMEFV